ncbi:hypothetical protein [Acetobacter persici]|uniref:Lipoprotein n=1 Tax=Acetobacter persici TaxID=1076596 RepID=A0A1U9LDZ3_9PROT|nr:hypothetical protein [Acetobacter persici]AQT04675.1 hypothetical protein A0U91_06645 [Acetobacter persici]
MTHRKFLLLVSMLSLAACQVPTAKERRQLDSMIGKQAVDVVRTYGVPTRQFVSGNHTFMSYINQQTDYSMPMSGWGYGGWGGGWGGGFGGWGGGWGGPGWGGGWGGGGWGGTAYTYTCQTNFELVNGVVSAWTMRGDGC